MKKQVKNTMAALLVLIAELTLRLKKFHNDTNTKLAPFEGKQRARKELPEKNEDVEPYFSKIKSVYIQFFTEARMALKGTNKAQSMMANHEFDKNISNKEQEKTKTEKHRDNCVDDQCNIPTQVRLQSSTYAWVIGILSAFDAISFWNAFTGFFRDKMLTAIVMAGLSSIALLGLMHLSVVQYRDTTNKNIKRFIQWVLFPIIIFAAGMIGELRYLQTIKDHAQPSVTSEVIMIVISVLVVIFNGVLVYVYAPSKADRELKAQWKELDAEIKKDEVTIQNLTKEINQLEQDKNCSIEYYETKRQALIELSILVQEMYQESANTLISHNIRERKTAVPNGFKKPIKRLDLNVDDVEFSEV